jgi:hypothetical protein
MPGSIQTSNGPANKRCQALPWGHSCSDDYESHWAEAERLRQEGLALPWYAVNARQVLIRQAWRHVEAAMECMLPQLRKTFLASNISK